MFWPDISPSLREAKSSVCHYGPVEGRRGNPNYSKKRYIWTPVRILHETEKGIWIDSGMKIWIAKSRIYRIRLRNNTGFLNLGSNLNAFLVYLFRFSRMWLFSRRGSEFHITAEAL